MASYEKIKNLVDLPVSFNPTGAFPVDSRTMFGSYDAAVAAAATAENAGSTNTAYYIGMELTVFENDVVTKYTIQPDKTLKANGAQVIGDDKTITIGEDGVVSVKDFGVKYYKYIAADKIATGTFTYPDTMPENPTEGEYAKAGDKWYKYTGGNWAEADAAPVEKAKYELTTGWKAGLEPKVALNAEGNGYQIAWYEPSATTVEGLSSSISTLQTNFDTLSNTVSTNKTDLEGKIREEADRAKGVEGTITADLGSVKATVNKLDGDVKTEGSVKYQISEAIAKIMNNDSEAMDSIKEIVDWIQNNQDAANIVALQNTVSGHTTQIGALNTLVGKLPEGITATDVVGYIKEVVKAEEDRATGAEGGLDTRLTTAENTLKTIKSAATHAAEDFATKEQGAKADTAVQKVVKGETNGHIAVDGTDVEVYTLESAAVDKLGGIKPDGSSITVSEAGVASVAAVDSSKVTGLDTALDNKKTEAVDAAKAYTDENAIAKTAIATSANVADADKASDVKVISEKLFVDAMTWKTTM